MANSWQLQKAKAELSKVIDTSVEEGPQTVTRHGRPAAVIVSIGDFEKLTRKRANFKAFLRSASLDLLDLERRRDPGRKVDL